MSIIKLQSSHGNYLTPPPISNSKYTPQNPLELRGAGKTFASLLLPTTDFWPVYGHSLSDVYHSHAY